MEIHDFGARKNMRKKSDRTDFEYFEDCGSMKCGAIRSIIIIWQVEIHDFGARKNMRKKSDRTDFECFKD